MNRMPLFPTSLRTGDLDDDIAVLMKSTGLSKSSPSTDYNRDREGIGDISIRNSALPIDVYGGGTGAGGLAEGLS